MKVARFVLKIVGWSLAFAAAVCCIIAYWDKLTDAFCSLREKCGGDACACHSEFDDYADWDD